MKGVITANDYNSYLNSQQYVLPFRDKPLIMHSIDKFIEAGIRDILIVTNKDNILPITELINDDAELDADIFIKLTGTYSFPEAIRLSKGFVGKDKFIAINANTLVQTSFTRLKDRLKNNTCVLTLNCEYNTVYPSYDIAAEFTDGKLSGCTDIFKAEDGIFYMPEIAGFDETVFSVLDTFTDYVPTDDLYSTMIKSGVANSIILPGWGVVVQSYQQLSKANKLLDIEIGNLPIQEN